MVLASRKVNSQSEIESLAAARDIHLRELLISNKRYKSVKNIREIDGVVYRIGARIMNKWKVH